MESKIWQNKEYIDNYNKSINNSKKQLDNFIENNFDLESDFSEDSIVDIEQLEESKLNFFNDNLYFTEEYLIIKFNNEDKKKIPITFFHSYSELDNSDFFEKIIENFNINFDGNLKNNILTIKEYFVKYNLIENNINNKLKKLNFNIDLDKRFDFEDIIKNDNDSNLKSYSTYDSSDNDSISSKNSLNNDLNTGESKPKAISKGKSNKNALTIKIKDQKSIDKYREQEYQRYLEPNKPWCFILEDGSKRNVGPVSKKNHNSVIKARDHFLLKSERPSYVTLLSLVRDAASKLPDGIGTRTDICQLLKESQFINDDVNEDKLSNVVSGALDRLHYEEDPCVKYDNEKKLWTYLHLNRELSSEEWFKKSKKKKSSREGKFKIKIPLIK